MWGVSIGKARREAEDRRLCSVPENEHDRVATENILEMKRSLLTASCPCPWHLCPHLLDVLQHHVGVTVESFDSCEQLLVVAKGDEDLCVVANGLLEDRRDLGRSRTVRARGFETGPVRTLVR